jgi:hypothetical protein
VVLSREMTTGHCLRRDRNKNKHEGGRPPWPLPQNLLRGSASSPFSLPSRPRTTSSRTAWRPRQIRGRSRRPRTTSSRGRASSSSRLEHNASAWPPTHPWRRSPFRVRWGPPPTAIVDLRPSPTAGEPPMAKAGSSSSGPSSWATCATPPTASACPRHARPCLHRRRRRRLRLPPRSISRSRSSIRRTWRTSRGSCGSARGGGRPP